MSNVTELPSGTVHLDLDAEERVDPKEPYTFTWKGRQITMTDPEELTADELMRIADPRDFIHLCMAPDDRKFLKEKGVKGWQFGRIMKGYNAHYDIDDEQANFGGGQSGALRGL